MTDINEFDYYEEGGYDIEDFDGHDGIYDDDDDNNRQYLADNVHHQNESNANKVYTGCDNSSAALSLEASNSRSITFHRKLTLRNKKEEILHLIQQLSARVDVANDELTSLHILSYFTVDSSWIKDLIKRISESSVRGFQSYEIVAFLEFVSLCHFYNKSPTSLCNQSTAHMFTQPLMSLERFLEILYGLDHVANFGQATNDVANTHQNSSGWSSRDNSLKHLTKAVLHLSEDSQDVAFTKTSIIALDDDKLRHRNAATALSRGVAIHSQRNSGKAGPVMLLAVSSVGLVLSAQLLMSHENNTNCALKTLACMSKLLLL